VEKLWLVPKPEVGICSEGFMRATSFLLALLAIWGGCSSAELIFSEQARQELVANFEASVDAQQLIAEYSYAAARGELDLTGAVYTPPVGSTPGSLTFQDGVFPFGTGDFTVNFTVQGDGGYVDPYGPGVDLTTHTNVAIVADAVFTGISNTGRSMGASADFTATTLQNGLADVQATVDGLFQVDHAGYEFDFTANGVEMGLDLVNDSVTSVVGSVNGSVDIPDFIYDADFSVEGVGDALDVDIDAVVTSISYTLLLAELGL
jgi:hypothetical protein